MTVRAVVIAGALVVSTGVPALAAPFMIDSKNAFVIACKIDGMDEVCQLDSGDNATATLRPLPVFAALPVIQTKRAMGVAGVVVTSDVVRVSALSAGELVLKDVSNVQRSSRPQAYSTLGLGFFRGLQTVIFDFRRFELLRGPPEGPACPGRFAADELIRLPATLAGQPITVGWDTGASITVADAAYVAAHPSLFTYIKDMPPGDDSTSSGLHARLYLMKAFAVCGRAIDSLPVVAVDMSAPKAETPNFPDLILGSNLMRGHVWSFDFRDGRWSFD